MVDLGPSLQSELPLPAAAPLPGGTRTMKTLIRSALALTLPAVLAAQQPAAAPPANPITGAFKARIGGLSRNIAQAFDSIPESKLGYTPTPAQLSIGFIAQHVASDNYLFCDQFGEKKSSLPEKDTATPDSVKATWPKDTLVAKLKASFAFCQDAMGQLEDGKSAAQRQEGDFVSHHIRFANGDTIAELRIHYTTLGRPTRDARGVVRNAVLLLHGTTGSGTGLERPMSPLFAAGEPLDTSAYYVILPDGIGHGRSSKPSDGLRMRFPEYTYDDMVDAQHRLLAEGLGVGHLRLVMGTSMGCMHAWVWGERYPDFVDALVPLACLPTAIAGRNRMMRRMIIDDIQHDPDWKGGDYTAPPLRGMRAAMGAFFVLTSAPLVQQRMAPTRQAADSLIAAYLDRQSRALDANDVIYAFQASRDYDPSPNLDAW